MSNKNSIFSPIFKYKAPVLNLERRWYGVDPMEGSRSKPTYPRIQRHVVTGLNHEEPNFVQQDIPNQACCRDNCDCTNGRECPNVRKVVPTLVPKMEQFHPDPKKRHIINITKPRQCILLYNKNNS